MALEVILRLDIAQEISRDLSDAELTLRRGLKRRVMGLAVIERSRKKQASRITNLQEGNANTRFFHQKVKARHRKNNIQRLQHEGAGPPPMRTRPSWWRTTSLHVPRFDFEALKAPFTGEEILKAMSLTPSGKAPGPDGFTANIFKSYWKIISGDLITALNTIHDLRWLNLDLLNMANIIMLPKKEGP